MRAFAMQVRVPVIRHVRYLAVVSVVIAAILITALLLWTSAGHSSGTRSRQRETPASPAAAQGNPAGTQWWQGPPQPTPPGGNPFIGAGPIGH
jgi:hypothetical protein